MPNPDRPPLTRAVVLRGIGFAAAIALGAVAVWLTVTSDSQKSLRIGMLVGLWGLLLGAYSMFGARRGMGVEATDDPGREIAVRERRTLERSDDADARRDWEARLERLITREISTAVGRETAALRNEIAHLRQELVDKVGGQLRLERIETTRVIGSDLEALQDEVRQLKDASGSQSVRELLVGNSDPRVAVRPVVEPARVRPVSRPTAEIEADVRPAVRPDVAPLAPSSQWSQWPEPTASKRPAESEQPAARATGPGSSLRPQQSAPVARPSQSGPSAASRSDDAAQRTPISQAAALAAQARSSAAASPLGGQQSTGQRRVDTPPPSATPPATPPATPSRPAAPTAPADRPADAAALVHRAPPATTPPPVKSQPPVVGQPPVAATPAQPRQSPPQSAPQAPQQPRLQQPATPQQPTVRPPSADQPAQPAAAKRQPPTTQPTTPPTTPAKATPAVPAASDPADPFAALPRLSRFTDFELDPVETGNGNGNGNGNGHHAGNGAGATQQPTDPTYSGRRRRTADEVEAAAEPEPSGRHANNGATPPANAAGGRRRRDENGDDGSELLARLLARETSER